MSAHAVELVKLELRLAKAEMSRKAAALGAAAAFGVLAVIVSLFAVGFLLAAATAALDEVLPLWAALLLVTAGLLLAATWLGFATRSRVRASTPPTPTEAADEARATTAAIIEASRR